MNTLKTYITKNYNKVALITLTSLSGIVLLTARIKLTHSFFYLFLVWNLFLAIIPYIISSYLVQKLKINKVILLTWSCIWLAFLPNAPYIITDLWHLRLADNSIIWLDILIVFSFASTGLLLFFLTIKDMKQLLSCYFPTKIITILFYLLFPLSSFGIYLGRFLRYNSWEILSNPIILFNDIYLMLSQPIVHQKVWLFTIGFSLFLAFGYLVFNSFKLKTS